MRVSEADLSPGCSTQSLKTIYGADSRFPVECFLDERVRRQADAVAVLVAATDLRPAVKGFQTVAHKQTLAQRFDLCPHPKQRFADDLSLGFCTAFLVGDELLATSEHCFEHIRPEDTRAIFVHASPNQGLERDALVATEDVYELEGPRFDDDHDLVVAQLKPSVGAKVGRTHLDVEEAVDGLSETDSVYVIGHPSGLPKIGVTAIRVRSVNELAGVADLDTFAGNSGSPVFSVRTGRVVGVLRSGACDYVPCKDSSMGCRVPYRCKPDECSGESFVRSQWLYKLSKGIQ